MPIIGETIRSINVIDKGSVRDTKSILLSKFRHNGEFKSLENVIEELSELEKILKIDVCLTKTCRTCDSSRDEGIEIPYFQSHRSNDKQSEFKSVQELLLHSCKRIVVCNDCNLQKPIRKYIPPHVTPIMFAVCWPQEAQNFIINKDVNLVNNKYTFFAIGYYGKNHFIALIKHNNQIFLYDGMKNEGCLVYLKNYVKDFTPQYSIDHDKNKYIAQIIWYSLE